MAKVDKKVTAVEVKVATQKSTQIQVQVMLLKAT